MALSAVAFCVIYDALPVASPGLCRIGLAGQLMRSTHCVCGRGVGERRVQIWLQLEFCGFCVSILCLLLTLLHLIVESCQRSRRRAACSKQHVACGMPIGGKPHRHLRLFWVVLFSHSAVGTVHDNLCLILPIKPLHAHCESNRALVWP